MSQLITLDHVFSFAARIIIPNNNNHHDDDNDDNEFASKILDSLVNSPQQFSKILFKVFPSLNNFVSQDEIGADDEQNWETISVLTNSILGIPSSVISVSTKNQIVMIRNLAVLFFFDQVANDNSFQGEFTLTSSHSLSLPKILKMNILADEIVLPDEIVEFVQSKESANVLLRGGCIPVISGRQQQKQQRTKTTTSTNRQLEFSRADEIETDDENEEKKFTNVVNQRNEEEHEETKSSIRASCEALRHILTSYSSMVDAALGNSEELSESSKHRTALQAGMKHIDQIEQELKFSFSKTTTTKNFVSPQSQGVSPGSFVQDQILGNRRGEMIMTEELQAMIIRVIRERDQAKEETMKLREELRMI
jgi:hypothetical protein